MECGRPPHQLNQLRAILLLDTKCGLEENFLSQHETNLDTYAPLLAALRRALLQPPTSNPTTHIYTLSFGARGTVSERCFQGITNALLTITNTQRLPPRLSTALHASLEKSIARIIAINSTLLRTRREQDDIWIQQHTTTRDTT